MLYLEDYLELIQHLPSELRDRFTSIRERDLQIQNTTELLKGRVKQFFSEAKNLTPEQRQCDHEKLDQEYQQAMKYADDKIQIATEMHDTLVKLLQHLDTECTKFKLELEADNAGITEELEKRSLELDSDTRLDNVINGQHGSSTAATSKVPSGIKDRRRSEHKHRNHPYQNNQDNGYQGLTKLSHQQHNPSKNSLHLQNNQRQGSKSKQNAILHRQQATPSPNVYSSISAPASVAGADLNGAEIGGLSSFGNNSGFKINSSNKPSMFSASASTAGTPQLNSVSALATMLHSSSVHNKISNNFEGNNLIEPNSPLVRHNPIEAAASQAIAATQQLQQGRRTPSLKASFAAINAGGLAPLDSLSNKLDALAGNSRNALAPMAPDQQAFRYNQFGKLSANGNPNPMYISKSGRPTKRARHHHHASHLYPDESPTSISSDNSVFENSESLSSADFIETASPSSLDFSTNATQGNTTLYHRDETKYCHCRQISYGEMVACDNEECEIEWFHYDCVGITQPPKGKWFCPECSRKTTMSNHQQTQSQPQTHKKRGRKEKSVYNMVNSSIGSKDRSTESM